MHLKKDSGKRVMGTGMERIYAMIPSDLYTYFEDAGNGKLADGIRKVGRYCMENIPAEEFHDD